MIIRNKETPLRKSDIDSVKCSQEVKMKTREVLIGFSNANMTRKRLLQRHGACGNQTAVA